MTSMKSYAVITNNVFSCTHFGLMKQIQWEYWLNKIKLFQINQVPPFLEWSMKNSTPEFRQKRKEWLFE